MPRTKQSRLIEALSEPLADKQVKVTRRKLSDYKLDPENANKGTERGNYMLDYSVSEFGPARSGVSDADGIIRAGSHTAEHLAAAGIEDVIEVETTGKEWVVVKRGDMRGDQAKRYGIADNRTAQVGIDYDADVLREMTADGLDLSQFFHEDELQVMLNAIPDATWSNAFGDLPTGDKSPFQQMTFTLSDSQAVTVKAAMDKAKRAGAFDSTDNENSNGNALWRICDEYLHS